MKLHAQRRLQSLQNRVLSTTLPEFRTDKEELSTIHPSVLCTRMESFLNYVTGIDTNKVDKSSQVTYRLLHGRLEKIGEASADTAATETYYMKGYYNLEEETIKVKI